MNENPLGQLTSIAMSWGTKIIIEQIYFQNFNWQQNFCNFAKISEEILEIITSYAIHYESVDF